MHPIGGEAGAAAARRAAAEMIAAPRVAGRRPGQVERWAANGEFVGRELAEQHPASRFKALCDDGVPAGDVALQDFGVAVVARPSTSMMSFSA